MSPHLCGFAALALSALHCDAKSVVVLADMGMSCAELQDSAEHLSVKVAEVSGGF